jgi:hypothetical protein
MRRPVSTAVRSPVQQGHFPSWVRWACILWMAVWVPAYWATYGWANFLHLCDIAVILTCIGLWRTDALLLSSQAVGSLLSDPLWALDVAWRLAFGHHLVGGTQYMWNPSFPLWVRLLSSFHIVLPVVLVWSVHRTGYDRRGWAVQSSIAGIVLVASRFLSPALNLNFAYRDPLLHRAWGPAPVHLAFMLVVLAVVFYLPVHWALTHIFPPAPAPVN